jgi:hypothetical protein
MSYFDDMRHDALLRTAYPPLTNQKAPEPVRNSQYQFYRFAPDSKTYFTVGQKQHFFRREAVLTADVDILFSAVEKIPDSALPHK